jgi:hypothetical protein
MSQKRMALPAAVLAIAIATFGVTQSARAFKLGDVLAGAGVVVLTSLLSKQINSAINTVTFNKGIPENAGTKVVPLIAMGSGTRVGAVQVSGPKDLVDKTKVVIQIQTKIGFKNLNVEIFVPSDSANPLKFNRVEGVGVSAVIDLRVSGL